MTSIATRLRKLAEDPPEIAPGIKSVSVSPDVLLALLDLIDNQVCTHQNAAYLRLLRERDALARKLAQAEALVRLLYPDEITPTAKHQFDKVLGAPSAAYEAAVRLAYDKEGTN